MNANRHRIVYNRARGLFMAVPQGDLLRGIAESASTQGKSPAGGSGSGGGGTATAAPPGFSLARMRPAAFAALLACGAQLALMSTASAQVVAYKAAPASQRPTILTAGNGVPLINIQTPSAAGVSRNTYEQFDVQSQGVILNNSRTNTATQLGGWVQGNPWLARGSARVILNEVISANPSQLLGYVEVAGSAAQVVIANPAGVTCNGCGFINASRATLTTGTPIVNGGNLEGYRVEGGSIRVEGAGMDASRVGYTDLIARAVEVNAGIWAQTLKVTAGANVVDADNSQATAIAGSGAAPAFAIDVAQLGGMYAGKIVLVGTEAGVGVRNAGHLGASAGEVRVTVDGKLTNVGEIVANGNLAIAATSLENRNLIDGRETRIDIAGTLDNLGPARIYGDHLAIAAGTLNNHAEGADAPTIAARSRLDLGVGTLSNRIDALIFSAGDLAIGGALDANNRATGSATLVHNHGATIEAIGHLDIAAADIRNTNANLVTQTVVESSRLVQEVQPEGWPQRLDVQYFPTIFNYGIEGQAYVVDGVVRGGFEDYTFYQYTATTAATEVVSSKPGRILAGGNASFTGNLENSDSKIIAGGTLAHTGGSLTNTATPGVRTTTYSGWAQFRDWDGDDEELDFGPVVGFNPAPTVTSFDLGAAAWSAGSTPAGVGTTPAPGSLTRPAVGANYLLETDPQFASYRQWLSSDYMLQQLAADPATTQKRLGDGFYEQRLLTEQIASLTGRRFLTGYQNEEAQFLALMNAGITLAREWQLRPGVALSAEQMAQLTTDMVWLVEKEITLPDGRKEKALVPQLYARVQPGDLSPAGSLLSGETLNIATTGQISNSGTLAGRKLVSLTAENIENLGGTIAGEAIEITARQDIAMQGGSINAGNCLELAAGRNIDIKSATHESENKAGGDFSRTNIERVAGLYVQNPDGQMRLAAAGDVRLLAAQLQSAGSTRIDAGGNLLLGTVAIEEKNHTGGQGYRNESGSRREVGTRIAGQGDVTLVAGNTLTARAAEVTSQTGALVARANDIVLEAGEASSYSDISQQKKSSGFLSSKSKSQRDAFEDSTALASTFSGERVALVADRDIQVKGSNVVATNDATLIAGRNLNIEAASESQNETHTLDKKKSGFLSSGLDALNKTKEAVSAKGSVISAGRDLSLMAGQESPAGDSVLTLQGSALDAGRDLALQTTGDLQLLAAVSQSRETTQRTTQGRKKLETLNFELEQNRALLSTLTAGNRIDLNVGGNVAAQVGSTDAAGNLQADRMTAAGVIKGSDRQQVSLTHTDDDQRKSLRDKKGTTTNGPTSKVLGNLAAQGIRSGANDSFAPEALQTGQAAVTALMQNGLLNIRNQPALQATLNAPVPNGSALTYKDDSGRVTLTVAGQAKVQAVYNQLKLTETFDVKHFADQGTAQVVTLVAAIALTVMSGGTGAAMIGATAGTASAAAANAAFIAMASTMTGQLAAGASFDQAFQMALKAGTTSAITAGILNTQMIDTAQGMQSINQLANVQTTGANIVGNFNADTFGQNLLGIGARGVVNAGVSAAINGGSFGDAFRGSVVGDLAAVGANAVGVSTDVHSLENIGGHALIGAVAAKLQGGDAVAGAMGGATAAIVNPYLDLAIGGADGSGWGADPETAQKWRFGTLQLASMATAATLASATGKDGMGAALAAQNETVNNWLHPKEQELKWRAGKACDAGNERGCQIGALLNQRDASREATPSARFSSGFANALVLAGGGALLMPVEITKAIAERRSVEFAIDVLKGIAGMPAHLYQGLSSDDPAMRGAAFAESMMVVAGSAALARSFSQGVSRASSTATGSMSAVDAEMVANRGTGAALQGVKEGAAVGDTVPTLGPGWSVTAPRGLGSATGPLPPGYTTVSRWVGPDEAAAWAQNGGTAIPNGIGAGNRVYVTALDAAKPGGTGPIRIDFAVPEKALSSAGKPEWFQMFQPMPSTPIYNVQIHVPPGIVIPKAK